MALSKVNPKEAGRLRKIVQESAKDPDSSIYRSYARPTNKAALQELSRLGIDTAHIDRDWFEKNAWLGQYARTDTFGLPVPPKQGSSKEETAAYYYTRLLNAQALTQRAEAELDGLKREIGYWANRKDRNYSDGEVLSRIDWNNYPALSMLRRDQQKGLPTELNKAIDFDRDTEFGMLWSARNGKTSGSNTIDAAKYALGEGQSFVPDDMVRSQRDPQSPAYNPYAMGSTVDEAAQYFQVDAFDLDWLKKNRRILSTWNETAIRMYNTVMHAERFTRQAEAELNDLNQAIDKKLDLAAASGRVDASGILRDAFVNYPALRRMDEGRLAGQPAQMTRALHYRAEDIIRVVGIKAEIINRRMGSTKDSRDLEDAAQNEKAAVIADQGNALQRDIAPRSLTASRSLIWEDGLLAATPYTLNNGVDSYSTDAASMITSGPASGEAEAEERLTQAGQYGAAAKAGYQKLMSTLFQGGEAFAKQGLSALASVEGAVSSAARVIINAAKGDQTGEEEDNQTQEGYDHMAEKLLGISPEAVGSIASFVGAAVGMSADARKGAAGLVSLLMETGAAALGTVTKYMLEGEEKPLSFLQTLSRLFMLRKAATGDKTDGDAVVKKALTEAVSRQMEGAQVHTGHGEFDTIATVAAQSGNSMETVQKRWGDAGINYFANLMEAGRSDVAAALQTLPSYARAVVVAEQNMRTVTLSPGMLMGQLAALKQDSEDQYTMKNAERRARLQAENGLMGQRIAGGALDGLIPYQKTVEDAKAEHDKDLLALDKAGKAEQTASSAHAAASALFLKNPADASAMDGLSMAIDQMVAAGEKWKTAEQAAAGSQKVLSFAQFRLDTQNQQAMGTLADEVKKEIDQKVKDALEQSLKTGEIPLNVSNFMDNAENKSLTLAPGNESGIIREDVKSLGTGDVMMIPGMGNKHFRALASAEAGTDVGFSDEYLDAQKLSGLSSSSSGGGKGPEYGPDDDVEVYWKDIQPAQALTSYPMQTPSPTTMQTPQPNGAGETENVIPPPTSGVGPIPIITPDPSSYQEPNFNTQATQEPQKDTIKGAGYTDDPNKVYQQWAEQYYQKHGIMPKITLPSAVAEGWEPRIKKIRYETKTIKTHSPTDVVKEVWGMIGEGTKLVGNAAGIAAQVFTGAPADKVSEVVDGALSILTKPQFFEGGAQFLDKVCNTGGTFEDMVDGVDQFFAEHTGDSYVQHTLTIFWDGIPRPQNATYTYNVYEGQKVDKDVFAGFTNALFFGKELGWE